MHPPDPTAAPDPPALAARVAACTLPKGEWTHHAHLTVGLWHVAEYGADAALARLRDGIRRLNDSHGTPNTDRSGYHETITCAYVRLLDQFLATCRQRDAHAENAHQLLTSPIAHRDALLTFYSRARLRSVEARRTWVEPDLLALDIDTLLASGRPIR